MTAYQNLLSRIRLVRTKWRMQTLIKGLALFLVSAVATLVLGVWGADLFGFRPAAVWLLRLLTGAAVVYVAIRFLYLPLRRRISDVQVAQYIEERYPQLEDRLITAVEFGQAHTVSPGMLDLLIKDALEKATRVDYSVFVNRKRVATYGGASLAALVALMALLNWGPSFFPYGFKKLYVEWTEASASTPLIIQVLPGNLELAKGTDQQVKAQLVGFDSPDVTLHVQPAGSTVWSPLPMEPESRGTGFRYLLVDVQSSLSYYVESRGVRSPSYNFKVIDLPRVERIDLTYNFPAYTGMTPQIVENEGDISAIKGTKVDLRIKLTAPARSAKLVFDDRSTVTLASSGERSLAGTINLQRSGTYTVQLVHSDGRQYAGSSEYQVEVIEDHAPKVTIIKPLRDVRATSVEEVFSEVKAEDDIGVEKVQMHLSVNGGEEKVLNLFQGKAQANVTAAHTFFLEEFSLHPGDVISYYGSALDSNRTSGPGSSSSDIYFIQIRPFEQKYIQNQSPPGGGGGGGEGQEALSRQQKEIISATFKLIRDKNLMEDKEYTDDLKSLALIQTRLQAQAQGLVERLHRRGAGDGSADFAKLAEYLKNAIVAMEKAAIQLGVQKPKEALPDEQKALQQLMRAEALFKEIQVSFNNSSSGGGGSQASAEDLADLFELELNKLKNQYETVQRGEQQAQDQQVDEALQRLKELAQRQQQINEQNRMMGQGRSSGSSGGGGQSQKQLQEEAQKLQRQLERLSRERSSPELNRASSQLQQAIEQMKRASEGGQRGNSQEATAQGIRALQQLDSARRGLSQGQDNRLNQEVEQAANESSKLLEEQKRVQEGVARIAEDKNQAASPEFQQRRKDLSDRKTAMAENLKDLANKIDDLAKRSRKTQRETSTKLNEASGVIRDRRLPERILQGNQLLESGYYDYIKSREDFVRANLEELQKQLQSAKNSLGQSQEGKLESARDKAQRLAEGIESLQQRLRNSQRGQPNQQADARGKEQGRQQSKKGGEGAQANSQGQEGKGQEGKGQEGQGGAGGQQGQQRGQQQGAGSQGGGGPQGGPQQFPNGGRPDGDVRGLTGNAQSAPMGVGPHSDEDFRQLRRETQERVADAQELRRLMDRHSTQEQNLDQIINALKRLDNARNYHDPDEVARLKQAIDLLRQVELDLSRELAQLVQKEKYFYSDDNEAPARYKKLVEEYYKTLAKGKP